MRGRPLAAKAPSELYLHFPAKPRYLDWQVGHGIVERYGPQQVPLAGRGFGRADLRVYPVDPLNRSFWPFPEKAVAVDEQAAPPAPGEEPARHGDAYAHIDVPALSRHLRTLGSPPVSTLVKLPLSASGGAARFGLDLAPHFARIAGDRQPGTYLVGIRRIDESTQRHWVRVQVTDLSLSTVDEEDAVKFAVTSLASGAPVAGAEISVEGAVDGKWATLMQATTGADGTYRWQAPGSGKRNAGVRRIVVRQGRDVLVLDPTRAPDRYGDNAWREAGDTWLQWTQESLGGRAERPARLCHVFTERPVYRPEEKVYIKGYARQRHRGGLSLVSGGGTVVVQGPGDLSWRYPVKFSAQGSFDTVFAEAAAPTGPYRVRLELAEGQECAGVDILKEAYRAPEFDLRLSAPDQVALDREFKVQLAAQYYAGGQVIDRPVRWRVTQFPYTWTPKTLPGFFFSSDGRFSGRERFQASPTLMREDKTDADGGATLALNPAIEPSAQPRSYLIEATVTGADDQTVTSTQRVLALPAVVLGVKAPRYLERAASVTPAIVALGPDGKPVAGQEVIVRLIRREWHAHLQAGDFSRAEAKYVSEVVDNKLLEKKVLSGREPIPVTLGLEGAGVYLIELETRDRLGRPQRVVVDFFAGGDQPVSWSRPPSEVFNATPDKPAYNPGETAHLILESPFQQAQGLAIIEAPEGNRYEWFNVRNGSAAFDVAVLKQYVPRVPVHFVMMRGRIPGVLPAPGTRLDLGKPATVAATAWLKVQPVEHQVTVTLDNPAKARPGETVDVRIKLADRAGKPLAGEVTLWLVDQAVLALGKEQRLDPLPDFITPVQSRLSLQDTRNWTLGLLPLDELPGGDAGKKEAGDDLLDKVTLRRDFQSVPYFNPNIQVGSSGEVVVRVKLPDNLTNFKLRAKAASGADRFGVATGQVSVRMPLIVQPALPRFVRPGDRFTATAIGRVVEGPAGAATAQVRAKGVEVAGGNHPPPGTEAGHTPAHRIPGVGAPTRRDADGGGRRHGAFQRRRGARRGPGPGRLRGGAAGTSRPQSDGEPPVAGTETGPACGTARRRRAGAAGQPAPQPAGLGPAGPAAHGGRAGVPHGLPPRLHRAARLPGPRPGGPARLQPAPETRWPGTDPQTGGGGRAEVAARGGGRERVGRLLAGFPGLRLPHRLGDGIPGGSARRWLHGGHRAARPPHRQPAPVPALRLHPLHHRRDLHRAGDGPARPGRRRQVGFRLSGRVGPARRQPQPGIRRRGAAPAQGERQRPGGDRGTGAAGQRRRGHPPAPGTGDLRRATGHRPSPQRPHPAQRDPHPGRDHPGRLGGGQGRSAPARAGGRAGHPGPGGRLGLHPGQRRRPDGLVGQAQGPPGRGRADPGLGRGWSGAAP